MHYSIFNKLALTFFSIITTLIVASSWLPITVKANPVDILPNIVLGNQISEPIDSFGGIPGHFAVTPDGSATYTIPIDVLPGIGNMQPNLSLNYNSSAGNGIVGMRWNLGGLSQISRCPKTIKHHGRRSAILFTTDSPLCLDGMLLKAVNGTNGHHNTEYRTLVDGNIKIVGKNYSNELGSWFEAHYPNGYVGTFGATTSSKAWKNINDPNIFPNGPQSVPLSWKIEYLTDPNGNQMLFEYGSNFDDGITQNHRVKHISYGYNIKVNPTPKPTRRVTFDYSRPLMEDFENLTYEQYDELTTFYSWDYGYDENYQYGHIDNWKYNYRGDVIQGYLHGSQYEMHHRLNKIFIESLSYETANAGASSQPTPSIIKFYRLDYGKSGMDFEHFNDIQRFLEKSEDISLEEYEIEDFLINEKFTTNLSRLEKVHLCLPESYSRNPIETNDYFLSSIDEPYWYWDLYNSCAHEIGYTEFEWYKGTAEFKEVNFEAPKIYQPQNENADDEGYIDYGQNLYGNEAISDFDGDGRTDILLGGNGELENKNWHILFNTKENIHNKYKVMQDTGIPVRNSKVVESWVTQTGINVPINYDGKHGVDLLTVLAKTNANMATLPNFPNGLGNDSFKYKLGYGIQIIRMNDEGALEEEILNDGLSNYLLYTIPFDINGDGFTDVAFCRGLIDVDAAQEEFYTFLGKAQPKKAQEVAEQPWLVGELFYVLNIPGQGLDLFSAQPMSINGSHDNSCAFEDKLHLLDIDGDGVQEFMRIPVRTPYPEGKPIKIKNWDTHYQAYLFDPINKTFTKKNSGLPLDLAQRVKTPQKPTIKPLNHKATIFPNPDLIDEDDDLEELQEECKKPKNHAIYHDFNSKFCKISSYFFPYTGGLSIDKKIDINEDGLVDIFRFEVAKYGYDSDLDPSSETERFPDDTVANLIAIAQFQQYADTVQSYIYDEVLYHNYYEQKAFGRLYINTGNGFKASSRHHYFDKARYYWQLFLSSLIFDVNNDGRDDKTFRNETKISLLGKKDGAHFLGIGDEDIIPAKSSYDSTIALDLNAWNVADLSSNGTGDLIIRNSYYDTGEDEEGSTSNLENFIPIYNWKYLLRKSSTQFDVITKIKERKTPIIASNDYQKTNILYKPMTDNSVYENSNIVNPSNNHPVVHYPTKRPVVASVEKEIGTSPYIRSFDYFYENNRYDFEGAGYLGPQYRTVREISYHDEFEHHHIVRQRFDNSAYDNELGIYLYRGKVRERQEAILAKYDDNSNTGWFKHDVFKYDYDITSPQDTYRPKLLNAQHNVAEVLNMADGFFDCIPDTACANDKFNNWLTPNISSSTSEYFYDDYGNVELHKVTTAERTYSTQTEYENKTNPWIIGLPKQILQMDSNPHNTVLRRTDMDYDDNGNVLWVEREPLDPQYNQKIWYYYNDCALPTKQIITTPVDWGSRFVETVWSDNCLFPIETKYPYGLTTKTQWSYELGVPLIKTDMQGVSTAYYYDWWGKLTEYASFKANNWLGYKTEISYKKGEYSSGWIITTSTPGLGESSVWYNKFGQVRQIQTKVLNGITLYQNYSHDQFGQLKLESLPYEEGMQKKYTQYQYDPLNRTKQITYPDNSKENYDYVGLETTHTDALGRENWLRTDDVGHVVSWKAPEDNVTVSAKMCANWGAYGTLIKLFPCIRDLTKEPIIMEYDRYSNQTYINDKALGKRWAEYNPFGERALLRNADGTESHYQYDALGRVTRRTTDEGTNQWNYDETTGLLANTKSTDGHKTEYTYDGFGRLKNKLSIINNQYFEFGFEYDEYNRLAYTTYPTLNPEAPFVVANQYDDLGNLVQVNNAITNGFYWRLDGINELGQITKQRLGNGVRTEYSYDHYTGLLENIHTSMLNTTVQDINYAWNKVGNLTAREDKSQGDDEKFELFFYNARNELITNGLTHNGGISIIDHEYDKYGRKIFQSNRGSYQYSGERIHKVQNPSIGQFTAEYSHDLNGNRDIQKVNGIWRLFDHTVFNKIRSINSLPDDEEQVEIGFEYDADDNRVLKIDKINNTATYYVDGVFEREYTSNPEQPITDKYYVVGGDGVSAASIRKYQDPEGKTHTEELSYLHKDHLGSIDVATNTFGQVTERMNYDPWGAGRDPGDWLNLNAYNPKSDINYGFTGHQRKLDGGLINMRGRMYDPTIGLFASADPFTFDRYGYVSNNPLSLIDPTGYYEDDPPSYPPLPQPPPLPDTEPWLPPMNPNDGGNPSPPNNGGNSSPIPPPTPVAVEMAQPAAGIGYIHFENFLGYDVFVANDGSDSIVYTPDPIYRHSHLSTHRLTLGQLIATQDKPFERIKLTTEAAKAARIEKLEFYRDGFNAIPAPGLWGWASTFLAQGAQAEIDLIQPPKPISSLADIDVNSLGSPGFGSIKGPFKVRNGRSGKAGSTDVPSWVKQEYGYPRVKESGKEFATRVLNDKYGKGNYPRRGSDTEFSQIQKWVDRSFKDPE